MPKVATPLTDTQIKKAKPQDKEHALYDGNGLRMIIPSKKSNKRKYFRFDYTRPNGKRNSLSLGIYPETSLAEARKMVQEYRGLLKKGIDPAQTRKEDKNSVDPSLRTPIFNFLSMRIFHPIIAPIGISQ